MLIELSSTQEERLLNWSAGIVAEELAADVEPAGYTLAVDVAGPLGCWATAIAGPHRLDLGEVVVTLSVDRKLGKFLA